MFTLHLDQGSLISITLSIVDHAVNDLYMKTNCLLADFSFTDSNTLPRLFNTYCTKFMVVHYGDILIEKYWNHSILRGENLLE